MQCPHCGVSNPANGIYCLSCGGDLRIQPSAAPTSKQPNPGNTNYQGQLQGILQSLQQSPPPQPPKSPQVPPQPQAVQIPLAPTKPTPIPRHLLYYLYSRNIQGVSTPREITGPYHPRQLKDHIDARRLHPDTFAWSADQNDKPTHMERAGVIVKRWIDNGMPY